jgi:glycosyltransferase involved in cell wall biosynthesis
LKVTVIIPCRNERDFIASCLRSIVANDYPRERLEVFVVDGMSDDGTREIVVEFAEGFPHIKLVDNVKGIAASGLNVGIRQAAGDLIMIMGAHNSYPPDYISRCVQASIESGADNVGGVIRTVPRAPGALGKAIALSLSHRFGIGNAHFRFGGTSGRREADTVFGGCYQRGVFARIGLFNEKLVFNQDIELNRRLLRARGRIVLDTSIVSDYHARSSLTEFWRHNYRNGSWVIFMLAHCDGMPVSWRHFVPLAFVMALLIGGIAGLISSAAAWFFFGAAGCYLAATLIVASSIAARERDLRLVALMPLAFASLHLPYGIGSCVALLETLARQKRFRGDLGGESP